eukprot:g4516.t1
MVLASDVEEGISATDPLLGSKGRTESEAIATFRKTLQVPFLRTFIVCGPLSRTELSNINGTESLKLLRANVTIASQNLTMQDSKNWSGSYFCADRVEVAQQAQMHHGMSNTASALVQVVVLPITGILSDRYGRVALLVLAVLGITLEFLFYSIGTMSTPRPNIVFIYIGAVIQGLTGSFHSIVNAMMADLSVSDADDELTLLYTLLQTCQGIAMAAFGIIFTGTIVHQNLFDYSGIWIRSAFFTLGLCLLVYLACPETLSKTARPELACKSFNPFRNGGVFRNKPFTLGMVAVVFLFSLGAAAIYTLVELFVVAEYSWTQEFASYTIIYISCLAGISFIIACVLVTRWGARLILKVGLILQIIGAALLCFSRVSVWFFCAGLSLKSLGAMAFVSAPTIISKCGAPHELGELNTWYGSAFLLALACGMSGYSILFRTFQRTKYYFVPFLVACLSIMTSALLFFYLDWKYPEAHEAKIEDGTKGKAKKG